MGSDVFAAYNFNVETNELDPSFVAETHVPLVKLFQPGHKDRAPGLQGSKEASDKTTPITAASILEFAAEHMNKRGNVKFDLAKALVKLQNVRTQQMVREMAHLLSCSFLTPSAVPCAW